MNLFKTTLLASVVAAAGVGTAQAAQHTESFQVTITITESCTINSASNVDFGDKVRSSAGDVTANGTINVTCTPGTAYQIGLSNGDYYASGSRRMAGTGGFVPYNLYLDGAMTQNWGQNWGTADVASGIGDGSAQPYTVFGRVSGSGNVNVPAGVYSDTIIATVAY